MALNYLGSDITFDTETGNAVRVPGSLFPRVPSELVGEDGEKIRSGWLYPAPVGINSAASRSLSALTDVSSVSPEIGDVLVHNGRVWQPQAAPPADISFSDIGQLNNVDPTFATHGQLLTWDGPTNKWVPRTFNSSANVQLSLHQLTDVHSSPAVINPTEGEVLTWVDAYGWTAQALPAPIADPHTINFRVTRGSSLEMLFSGADDLSIAALVGSTIIFDFSDPSNQNTEPGISETLDGIWNVDPDTGDQLGFPYTDGVILEGLPGEEGCRLTLTVNPSTPDTLYLYDELSPNAALHSKIQKPVGLNVQLPSGAGAGFSLFWDDIREEYVSDSAVRGIGVRESSGFALEVDETGVHWLSMNAEFLAFSDSSDVRIGQREIPNTVWTWSTRVPTDGWDGVLNQGEFCRPNGDDTSNAEEYRDPYLSLALMPDEATDDEELTEWLHDFRPGDTIWIYYDALNQYYEETVVGFTTDDGVLSLKFSEDVWSSSRFNYEITEVRLRLSSTTGNPDQEGQDLSSGDFLRFDGAHWRNQSASLNELSDVALNLSPADGESLSWDGTAQEWKAEPVIRDWDQEISQTSINDLADIDTSTLAPEQGQALVWDDNLQVWSPGNVASVGGGGGGGLAPYFSFSQITQRDSNGGYNIVVIPAAKKGNLIIVTVLAYSGVTGEIDPNQSTGGAKGFELIGKYDAEIDQDMVVAPAEVSRCFYVYAKTCSEDIEGGQLWIYNNYNTEFNVFSTGIFIAPDAQLVGVVEGAAASDQETADVDTDRDLLNLVLFQWSRFTQTADYSLEGADVAELEGWSDNGVNTMMLAGISVKRGTVSGTLELAAGATPGSGTRHHRAINVQVKRNPPKLATLPDVENASPANHGQALVYERDSESFKFGYPQISSDPFVGVRQTGSTSAYPLKPETDVDWNEVAGGNTDDSVYLVTIPAAYRSKDFIGGEVPPIPASGAIYVSTNGWASWGANVPSNSSGYQVNALTPAPEVLIGLWSRDTRCGIKTGETIENGETFFVIELSDLVRYGQAYPRATIQLWLGQNGSISMRFGPGDWAPFDALDQAVERDYRHGVIAVNGSPIDTAVDAGDWPSVSGFGASETLGWSLTYNRLPNTNRTGNTLDNLVGVKSAMAASDGQVLTFNLADQAWSPKALPGSATYVVSQTTSSLAPGSDEVLVFDGLQVGEIGYLMAVEITSNSWVTIYTSNDALLADVIRDQTEDPTRSSGVIADIICDQPQNYQINPLIVYANTDFPQESRLYARVHKTGTANPVTVHLTCRPL